MSFEIFFIDYENLQPTGIGQLKPGSCRLKLFLGQSQNRLPVDLTRALQPFGEYVEYLSISGSGPNAVDFHIAFYIGRLALQHPEARFTIVSRDTGFDPLVRHLRGLDIECRRIAALPGDEPVKASAAVAQKPAPRKSVVPASALAAKTAAATGTPAAPQVGRVGTDGPIKPGAAGAAVKTCDRVNAIVARLKGLKSAKPATVKTLQSSLKSWFKPPLDAKALEAVVASLTQRKLIVLDGTKVRYQLR